MKVINRISEYDYCVALITVTATEEAGLRHIYKDWEPVFLEGDGNTAALDMESYAVMYAVKEAPVPKPKGLVIKSVCDYAYEEKMIGIKSLRRLTARSLPNFCMRNF